MDNSFYDIKDKREYINKNWNSERLIKVLEKAGIIEADNYSDRGEYIIIPCPSCKMIENRHDLLFAMNINKAVGKCVAHDCFYDIWQILKEFKWINYKDAVELVYSIFTEDLTVNKEKINVACDLQKDEYELEEEKRKSKTLARHNAKKVLKNTTKGCPYLKELFSGETIQSCDVYFRDDKVNMEYNDIFCNRIIYAIKGIEGEVEGISARSICNESERIEFIANNLSHLKTGNRSYEFAKYKVINTYKFAKADQLYLLYKYVSSPQNYHTVVIVEGPKDALRVWDAKLPGVAVVASMGCSLSSTQIQLLADVFGFDIQIVLAYDNDDAGRDGIIKAYKDLTVALFENIRIFDYGVLERAVGDIGDMTNAEFRAALMSKSITHFSNRVGERVLSEKALIKDHTSFLEYFLPKATYDSDGKYRERSLNLYRIFNNLKKKDNLKSLKKEFRNYILPLYGPYIPAMLITEKGRKELKIHLKYIHKLYKKYRMYYEMESRMGLI